MYELNDEEYAYISRRVYDYARINLTEKKRSLIISRLSKRIRGLNLHSFSEYIELLKHNDSSESEFQTMVDCLSTNYSRFFREPHHFDYLTESFLPQHTRNDINIWSAASSTGQEVYSILMTLHEYNHKSGQNISGNLFASDISRKVLKSASQGIFSNEDTAGLDKALLKKYFLSGKGSQSRIVKVKNDYIKKIRFFRLNLNDTSYKLPVMDVIFLRNAIIYFDKETKQDLIGRLYSMLVPGGLLILGHSESLVGISDQFELIGRTVYRKRPE